MKGLAAKSILAGLLILPAFNCGGPVETISPAVAESMEKRAQRAERTASLVPATSNLSDYEESLVRNGLVDIREMEPSLLVDLKYASSDNFLDTAIYGDLRICYMRLEAAAKLALAQEELSRRKPGFRLLVYDGARPHAVQEAMWSIVKDTDQQNYVANPSVGSIHNFGCAVDLTIVDTLGKALDMGTPFDFFGKLAQPRYNQRFLREGKLTREQVSNRKLLASVMETAGFQGIPTEWWHFNAFGLDHVRENYALIK